MKIISERLEIVPLTSNQLVLLCSNITKLEEDLSCSYEGEPIEAPLLSIIRNQINICANNKNYMWSTFWMMIRKKDRVVVGSCAFKHTPNSDGEIEIGYGLGDKHRGKGYMTEGIKSISEWALYQKDVKSVIAETEPNNYLSENVLIRSGFSHYKTVLQNKWWRVQV